MAQQVQVIAAETEDLSSVHRTRMGEKGLIPASCFLTATQEQ